MAVLTTSLIVVSCIMGTAGIISAGYGGKKVYDAKKISKKVQQRNNDNLERLKKCNESACGEMDKLGIIELETLKSFKHFQNLMSKVHNRPIISKINTNLQIHKFEFKKIDEAAKGAEILLGGLSGAALGTAGGFAAAGATTSAVSALATASTGTAISTLHGAALINATLAALGGGSVATGGGGVAWGATVLGAASAGVAILVGGVIFTVVGVNLEKKAKVAEDQMLKNEKQINKICDHLDKVRIAAKKYYDSFIKVVKIYKKEIKKFELIIKKYGSSHVDWNNCTQEEKNVIENSVLLVHLLYNMCKIEIIKKEESADKIKSVNEPAIENECKKVEQFLRKYNEAA